MDILRFLRSLVSRPSPDNAQIEETREERIRRLESLVDSREPIFYRQHELTR